MEEAPRVVRAVVIRMAGYGENGGRQPILPAEEDASTPPPAPAGFPIDRPTAAPAAGKGKRRRSQPSLPSSLAPTPRTMGTRSRPSPPPDLYTPTGFPDVLVATGLAATRAAEAYIGQHNRSTGNIHKLVCDNLRNADILFLRIPPHDPMRSDAEKAGSSAGAALALGPSRSPARQRREVLAVHAALEGYARPLVHAMKKMAEDGKWVRLIVTNPPCLSRRAVEFWMKMGFNPDEAILKFRALHDGKTETVQHTQVANLMWEPGTPFNASLAAKVREKFGLRGGESGSSSTCGTTRLGEEEEGAARVAESAASSSSPRDEDDDAVAARVAESAASTGGRAPSSPSLRPSAAAGLLLPAADLPDGWTTECRVIDKGRRKYRFYRSPDGKYFRSLPAARESIGLPNLLPVPPPLPAGWDKTERCTSSGRKYSLFSGPNGESCRSLAEVRRVHRALGADEEGAEAEECEVEEVQEEA